MATWRDVRRLALKLPGTLEERSASGRPWWMVGKKSFAWERPLRKSDLAELGASAPEGPILGLRTGDLEFKEILLATAPAVFFTTSHFDGYPAVLVRLREISTAELAKVLREAWLTRAGPRLIAELEAGTKASGRKATAARTGRAMRAATPSNAAKKRKGA